MKFKRFEDFNSQLSIINSQLVPLLPRHAAIVPRIRRADAEEIWAAQGIHPRYAIAATIATTDIGWAAEFDGEPEAIFGACASGAGSGFVWLIATDVIEKYPVHFYRVSKRIIGRIRERYDYLENWVDARNVLSLRWLKWAGFEIAEPAPWGVMGLDFCHISMGQLRIDN